MITGGLAVNLPSGLRATMFREPRHPRQCVEVMASIVDGEAKGSHRSPEQNVPFEQRITFRGCLTRSPRLDPFDLRGRNSSGSEEVERTERVGH
jgi:hypothetical protein